METQIDGTKLPYYETLVDARSILEREVPNFPVLLCFEASYVLEQCVPELKGIGGIVEVDNVRNAHVRNIDKERGVYIDLSLDQFDIPTKGIKFPPISITSMRSRAFKYDEDNDNKYRRCMPGVSNYATFIEGVILKIKKNMLCSHSVLS